MRAQVLLEDIVGGGVHWEVAGIVGVEELGCEVGVEGSEFRVGG